MKELKRFFLSSPLTTDCLDCWRWTYQTIASVKPFHIPVQTPEPNQRPGIQWVFNKCRRINSRTRIRFNCLDCLLIA